MFPSLSSRIAALGALVVAALLTLAGMLMFASVQMRNSFHWVTHSARVIDKTDHALVELREAESGQRGFIITRNPVFATSFDNRVAAARDHIDAVVALTADNAVQHARARELQQFINLRIAFLRTPLKLSYEGRFTAAAKMVAVGRSRDVMSALTMRARGFLAEERALQKTRLETASGWLAWVRQLALVGVPVIVVLVLLVSLLIIRGIRQPLGEIKHAMARLGSGEEEARITTGMGSREFADLARGYNAMVDDLERAVADRVDSEDRLQTANQELLRSATILRDRGAGIELLGGMAHRMQAARTDEELAQILRVFVPRVLPGVPGVLYAHNNSRNLLVPLAAWGDLTVEPDGFPPDECWALRRGQSHFVSAPGADIVCGHVTSADAVYHCEPLLAGGEVIGVLYLAGQIDGDERFQLTVLAENVASALVNHRLQRDLREQTIRDPLTDLFNRRYMEETLAIEIARAARSGVPLSVVMCDVDHFKRFNDEFGHDAGDAVLQAVAAEMRAQFRDGDVVCRYGGEEFTIIAPGTAAGTLHDRVEQVRIAIAGLKVRHAGRALGSTSMSFGIASWDPRMGRDGAKLIHAADTALYRAKREGRNRAVVELVQAA